MIDRASNHNRAHVTLQGTVAESCTLLDGVQVDNFFGYFYYYYAPASGRSFALGGSSRK